MIEVNDLCFDYPGKRALNHVSLTITPNSITALVGPNGAGKTTLLRCLCALELPMNGTVIIDGFQTDRFPRKVHQACSYLSDFNGLYDQLTVAENLTYSAWSHHYQGDIKSLVEKTAQRLDIWEYKDKQAGKLSRGLRQRLAIAQTIIHQPKVLLLDEPASGLDPEARYHLSKLLLDLQSEGMTIIVSSHILSELEEYSSDMIVLQEGKLIKQCSLVDNKTGPTKRTLKVEFTLDAKNYLEDLKALPNIQVIACQNHVVILELMGNQLLQQQLLKTLIDKQLPVLNVQEQKQSMQDVYMTIAEQHNQDKKSKDEPTKE